MAPQVGLEPTTLRLTAGCSAIELLRSNAGHAVETTRPIEGNKAEKRRSISVSAAVARDVVPSCGGLFDDAGNVIL